ncbi:MAG: fatty acid CoA ligase family protein [Bdellovibrionota bacterium]|jgi:acyl-CoA synthetase (AMP-forming)/AMP-acid ligase II/pimeloyl-ACP methyl ester carboxylesterase
MRQAELKKLLPYSSQFIDISGFKMHYLDEGSGPVVLLLHGNPTWCFYYRNLIAELKDKFRVIALDFIGCGLSDHPTDAHFRVEHRIEHLKEFIDKLGLDRFSLVMHDWGGSIGTAYAVRNPEKIEKLVYLNTTLTETETLPLIIKKAARPFFGKFLTKYSKWFLHVTTTLGVTKKLPKNVKKAYLHPYRTIAKRTAIWDFVADIPFGESYQGYSSMLELAEMLPRLQNVPVQIVWGLKDPCFHRGMLNKVAAHFPQAYILEIPDASHLVLEDAPQLACSTIKNFLLASPAEEQNHRHDRPNEVNVLYSHFLKIRDLRKQCNAIMVPSFLGDPVKYAQVTYEALNNLVNQYQRGLAEAGLRCGDKVIMLVSPGIDFLALSYAVMGRGGIPIFLDPGMGLKKLLKCIEDAAPEGFIVSPKAHLLRLAKPGIFHKAKFYVTASEWFPFAGLTTSFMKKYSAKPLPEVTSSGTCLIAYTSGATGDPKGVIFTDSMIADQLRIFKDVFGFSAENGEKDLPLLPVFSLFTVALGVCSVFPPVNPAKPLELEPHKIVRLINDLQIAYSFGSPALWNKISEYCVRSSNRLPSLRKIFMAGAPVQRVTLERLKDLLDDGEATTPYGATEALPVTLITMDQILNAQPCCATSGECGVLVGKQIASMRVGVIASVAEAIPDISDVKWLPNYQIGEVVVSGANVSPEYFENPQATKLAKIKDGDTFWHRMGDMGYLDAEGNLYFCGRKAHVVSCKGRTYYSVPTEKVFNAHPKVARSALIPVEGGQDVGIVVEPYPQYWQELPQIKERFLKELADLAGANPITADIKKFFFYKSFPVDGRHNAKIFRDRLAELIADEKC